MKRILFTTATVLALSICINSTSYLHSNPTGAPAGRTGAPKSIGSELTCAVSGCHGTTLNLGPHTVAMTITGDSASWSPDQTYGINVAIVGATGPACGFQIVALNPSKTSTGVFTNANTSTKLIAGSGRSYVTHTTKVNKNWTFNWKAPAASSAPDSVTFYLAGMENISTTGNAFRTYTSSFVFRKTEVTTATDHLIASSDFQIFPVPASSHINLTLNPLQGNYVVRLVAVDGKLIREINLTPGETNLTIDLPLGMKPGVYLLQTVSPQGIATKRFIKL